MNENDKFERLVKNEGDDNKHIVSLIEDARGTMVHKDYYSPNKHYVVSHLPQAYLYQSLEMVEMDSYRQLIEEVAICKYNSRERTEPLHIFNTYKYEFFGKQSMAVIPFDSINKFYSKDFIGLLSKNAIRSLFTSEEENLENRIGFYLLGTGQVVANSSKQDLMKILHKLGKQADEIYRYSRLIP